MNIRPYFIVPKLIPQPTWGGDYIANYKGLTDEKILSQKIGQSYELSTDTMLTTVSDPTQIPIEIGDPKTGKTIEVIGDPSTLFSLQSLIDQDPTAVLGKSYLEKFGSKMQILIKFTQAKGNSFQVHFQSGKEIGHPAQRGDRPAELAHWKPKPESWFFLERGRATLGLRPDTDIEAYKKTCIAIDAFMKEKSQQVREGSVSIKEAKAAIEQFLFTHSPFLFVNVVDVPKGSVIDLSAGGIHHSWEEGEDIPDGNIVYEVQLNVMDNDCTLRSFDKGKMSDDGTIRPVHIEDYFMALDTDPAYNDARKLIQQQSGSDIFLTPYYSLREDLETGMLETFFEEKHGSFVHQFATRDTVGSSGLHCVAGTSVFVPAA